MRRLIHAQVAGFLRAGKELRRPEGAVDRGASKLVAALLFLLGAGLVALPPLLDFLPARVSLRAHLVALAAFGFGVRFWRGVSVRWMLRGLLRYWLPTGLLLYIYFIVGLMLATVFEGRDAFDIGLHGGAMMIVLAVCAGLASWEEARQRVAGAEGGGRFRDLDAAAKAGVLALRFYALVWVAFFCGGLVMIAHATGLGDWFFQDVLGW